MRTMKRESKGIKVKSSSRVDILLTVEEAGLLVDCDPDVLGRLETLLNHLGFRKKNNDSAESDA